MVGLDVGDEMSGVVFLVLPEDLVGELFFPVFSNDDSEEPVVFER